jgi:hypothetical protein
VTIFSSIGFILVKDHFSLDPTRIIGQIITGIGFLNSNIISKYTYIPHRGQTFCQRSFFDFYDFFVKWVVWECIYVYTNRHVKIVYDLKVRVVYRTIGISGIWILTRMGVLTHTGTCTVYVRTVYCTEDRITRPRKIKRVD